MIAPTPAPGSGGAAGAVGVVGAGTIGSAMISRLVTDHRVVVWDPVPAARERAVGAGAVAAAALAALVDLPVVLLALPGPTEVRTVVGQLLDAVGDGSVLTALVDLSTVDPGTSQVLARAAVRVGVGYLDAPILGRPHRCGQWTLPVGGPEDVLAAARPVLDVLANRVVRVGDHGQGNVVKLLNNLMFGAINAITVETMAAAERLGLDPAVYADTLAESGAASVSGLFTELAPKIIAGDETPTFSVDLLTKDNRLALAMLEPTGLRLDLTRAVVALDERAQAAGLGALDTSAMIRTVRTAVDPAADPRTTVTPKRDPGPDPHDAPTEG